MKKQLPSIYIEESGLKPSDAPEIDIAKYVYISNNEECPYVGVEYEDGTFWIFGAKSDRQVTYEEMLRYLESR